MSAAPRTASTTPDLRSLALALGAVLVAIALVAAVALARPAATAPSAPAGATTTQFDHGTSSAASETRSLTVSGSRGGAIQYTGIPYPATDRNPSHGGRGSRFAQ